MSWPSRLIVWVCVGWVAATIVGMYLFVNDTFDGPYPDATRTITLTTTWSGTATNPFTGETQTINGLVTTKETTGPFYLDHLTVSNTDTWEEKQGH